MRKYTAYYDNGTDYKEIEYCSDHRANSKANFEDAQAELIRKYGNNAYDYTITDSYLKEDL